MCFFLNRSSLTMHFKDGLQQLINNNKQKRQHNTSPSTRQALRQLRQDHRFIVVPSDKNLGPAILERDTYKRRCLQDHLLDSTTYHQLSTDEATKAITAATDSMKELIESYKDQLPNNELVYFRRCFELEHRIPQFYITPKVHKSPWKTRPIVSTVNSPLGYLSKWIDRQLQPLLHLCPGYLQDSQSLLQKLQRLGPLPSTTVLVIADAVSMYTNIDTPHSIQALRRWLTRHKRDLPSGFPFEMVIAAMELVMTNNIFQFDNTYFHLYFN